MITITGLTARQKTLMDLLWTCATLADVEQLIQALPTASDQQDAQSLVKIATWESLEQEGALNDYSQDCADIISRVRSSR